MAVNLTPGMSVPAILREMQEAIDSGLSGGSTDVNYAELYQLASTNALQVGQWYRLTDYRSVNFLNGRKTAEDNPTPQDENFDPRQVYVNNETEVLLLQAISGNEFSPIGYSETYPGDIVAYNPLINKMGLNHEFHNDLPLPNETTLTGFDLQWDVETEEVYIDMPTNYPLLSGYFLNINILFNEGFYSLNSNYIVKPNVNLSPEKSLGQTVSAIRIEEGNNRIVFLDLNESNANDATLVSFGHYFSVSDAYGWIGRRENIQKNIIVPCDWRGFKYRRFEAQVYGTIKGLSITSNGITATDGRYYKLNPTFTTTDNGDGEVLIDVVVSGGIPTQVIVHRGGRHFENGDILTINGNQIGGALGNDDVELTVTNIHSEFEYCSIGDQLYSGFPINGNLLDGNYQDSPVLSKVYYDEVYNFVCEGFCQPYDYEVFDNNIFRNDCFNSTIIAYNFYNNTIDDEFENNQIGSDFNRNIMVQDFQRNTIGYSFTANIAGDDFRDNQIGNNFEGNIIEDDFEDNRIGNGMSNNYISQDFRDNVIGNGMYSNSIGDYFQDNTIGNNFSFNNIGNYFQYNQIGHNFQQNIISDDFGYGGEDEKGNKIGNYFYNNRIGEYFYNNVVADYFENNYNINNNFQLNTIKTSVQNQDFDEATHVYGWYNCDIVKASNSSLYLLYFDGSDLLPAGITD